VSAHRARKRFGQNFLQDSSVIAQIISVVAPRSSDRMIEIGPGQAALTTPLARIVHDLQLVEIDRDLVQMLQRQFPDMHIHQGDVLDFDFAALGDDLRIVGNLPYNISTPLLFHLSRFTEKIRDAHFMLQQEVVERLVAPPGSKTFGRLSVMMQYRWQMQSLFIVPPEAFSPQPQVHSAVVRMSPYTTLPHAARSFVDFSQDATQCLAGAPQRLGN
jgi:16S rRNA (adenine1518-N6/adenine1519-N6)-dimethyltransferase